VYCFDRFFVINTLWILIPYVTLLLSHKTLEQPLDGDPGTGFEERRTDVSASWYRARSRSVNSKAAAIRPLIALSINFCEPFDDEELATALQRIIRMNLLVLPVSDQ